MSSPPDSNASDNNSEDKFEFMPLDGIGDQGSFKNDPFHLFNSSDKSPTPGCSDDHLAGV